jgi:hypothetical protein
MHHATFWESGPCTLFGRQHSGTDPDDRGEGRGGGVRRRTGEPALRTGALESWSLPHSSVMKWPRYHGDAFSLSPLATCSGWVRKQESKPCPLTGFSSQRKGLPWVSQPQGCERGRAGPAVRQLQHLGE